MKRKSCGREYARYYPIWFTSSMDSAPPGSAQLHRLFQLGSGPFQALSIVKHRKQGLPQLNGIPHVTVHEDPHSHVDWIRRCSTSCS